MDTPSTFDSRLIEQIVREVLASLSRGDSAPPAPSTTQTSPPATTAPENPAPPRAEGGESLTAPEPVEKPLARIISTREGELTLSSKVITVKDLEEKLHGVRRLIVPSGAIITPAVADLLRQRNIGVFFGAVNNPTLATRETEKNAPLGVLLVTQRITPQQLDNLLRPEGLRADYEVMECLIRASERAGEFARAGRLAVILTRHVAAAVCLANRLRGVRAIAGRNPQDVTNDTTAVGANVLVADLQVGLFAIKRMIRQFVMAPHHCPEVFQERLERQ